MSGSPPQADSSGSTLPSWVQSQLTKLYTAADTTPASLFEVGDTSPFSEDVRITMNDNQMSKEEFADDVGKRKMAAAKVDVTYGDVEQQETNTVSGSITITRSMKFRIRAAPAQQEAVGQFTAKVSEGEPRKIVDLNLKLEDRAIPVNLLPTKPAAHGDEL